MAARLVHGRALAVDTSSTSANGTTTSTPRLCVSKTSDARSSERYRRPSTAAAPSVPSGANFTAAAPACIARTADLVLLGRRRRSHRGDRRRRHRARRARAPNAARRRRRRPQLIAGGKHLLWRVRRRRRLDADAGLAAISLGGDGRAPKPTTPCATAPWRRRRRRARPRAPPRSSSPSSSPRPPTTVGASGIADLDAALSPSTACSAEAVEGRRWRWRPRHSPPAARKQSRRALRAGARGAGRLKLCLERGRWRGKGKGERRARASPVGGRCRCTAVRRDLQRHARLFAARRGGRRCVPRQVLVGVEELRHVGELLVGAVVLLGRERHVRVVGREQPADHRRRRGERARRREERRLFFVQLALAPRDRLLDQLNEGLAVLPLGVRRRRGALGVHVDRAHLRQVENGAEAQAALAVRLRAAHSRFAFRADAGLCVWTRREP